MKRLAAVSALLVACAAGSMASPALGAVKKAATRTAAPAHAARTAVPFVEDDYARALAEARKRNVPVFIDAWAPW